MKKRSFQMAGLCLLLSASALAQPAGQSAPDSKMLSGTSPTGQGLGSLSSPNLFDGSTNISIPIYQYEGPGGSYGISFGYNTKGIKVDAVASDIGLGWTLQAGGSIVRNVKDLPDELNVTGPDTTELPSVWNGTSYGQFLPSIYTRFKGKYVTYSETAGQAANTKTYRDKETDEFNVSAGPLSFSFQMASDGSFFTIPENHAKIELFLDGSLITGIDSATQVCNSSGSHILTFKITDVQGNQYYFARGDYEHRRLYDEFTNETSLLSYYLTTKWDLSRVVLSSGAEIGFDYTSTSTTSMPYYNQSFIKEGQDVYGTSLGAGPANTEDGFYTKLLAIRYPNGTRADLIYDATSRCDYNSGALKQIAVSGGSNCTRYMLDQAWFMASNTGTGTAAERPYDSCYNAGGGATAELNRRLHRLKLKAIRILSCDSTVEEPYYSFTYNSGRLPMRLDIRQDFFGYANGAPTTIPSGSYGNYNFMVPAHDQWGTGTPQSGADKSENLTYMQSSVLTAVKNAYGGQMTFSYDSHSLSNGMGGLPSNDNYLGATANDGLRLQGITETDAYHPGNSRITTYTYSGGKRFMPGGYFHYPTVMADGTDSVTQVMFTGLYVTPHQLINGSNHGYGQVTVTSMDGSFQQLSKKVITFSNMDSSLYSRPAGGKHFYEFPYTDKSYIKSWEIGLPQSVTDYDENNHILQETFNHYSTSYEQATAITNTKVARVQRQNQNYPGFPSGIWQKRDITDTYYPVRGRADLDRTVTRKYVSDSRYVADTALFYYDDHHNLSTTETQNSRGQTIRSVNVYNYDVPYISGRPVKALTDAGLEMVVSTERWITNGGSNDKLLDASITGYMYQSGILWAKNLYKPETGSPIPYSTYEPNPSYVHNKIHDAFDGDTLNGMRKLSEVTAYDILGNPLESRLMDREQYKAMLWDSATGLKLAEAANCRYQQLFCTSFEESWAPLSSTATMGNFDLMTAGITTNTGLGGGPVNGRKAYRLHAGTGATTLTTRYQVPAGGNYRLSFWVKGNTAPSVTFAGSAVFFSSAQLVHTAGSWNNYQIDLSAGVLGSTLVSLVLSSPGTDVYVDEVRFFPLAASIQSYTYEPLFGMSSSDDASGRITYYEYDPLGRRTIVRDQDGYILSKTEQVVQGQD